MLWVFLVNSSLVAPDLAVNSGVARTRASGSAIHLVGDPGERLPGNLRVRRRLFRSDHVGAHRGNDRARNVRSAFEARAPLRSLHAVDTVGPKSSLPHIVVIGGGFGGIRFAREFPQDLARITIVDRQNHHLFQPLLYQVATSALSPVDIAQPIRAIFDGRPNLAVLMAEVTDVDLAARRRTARVG